MASDALISKSVRAPARSTKGAPGTTLVDTGTAFRALIVEAYSNLTPQQVVIADFLLEHLDEAALLSLPEIAERAGSSEATVVRFARRLGFSGVSELRLQLLRLLQAQTRSARRTFARPADDAVAISDELVETVVRRETENVQRSFAELDLQ